MTSKVLEECRGRRKSFILEFEGIKYRDCVIEVGFGKEGIKIYERNFGKCGKLNICVYDFSFIWKFGKIIRRVGNKYIFFFFYLKV